MAPKQVPGSLDFRVAIDNAHAAASDVASRLWVTRWIAGTLRAWLPIDKRSQGAQNRQFSERGSGGDHQMAQL